MSETETENAFISATTLGVEDHGILTCWLHLDYGDSGQSFGGWQLDKPDRLGWFVRRVLETLEVASWESLRGHTLRAAHTHSKVEAIGHFLKDQWFNPSKEWDT